jgi:hypothetical protein
MPKPSKNGKIGNRMAQVVPLDPKKPGTTSPQIFAD